MKSIAYLRFLDNQSDEQLRIRINTEKGKIIDILVQYESFIDNNWVPIIRYDCSHGFFHRDVLYPKNVKEKQVVSFNSLEEALNFAEQDIDEKWEFHKERYLKKLKK